MPVALQPGSPLAFRVGFRLWLPLRATVAADLSLLDPGGNPIKEDTAESEFPPAYSEAWATFTTDKMPEGAGNWIGEAVIKIKKDSDYLELARWSGYVANVAAPTGPSLTGTMTTIIGMAMLGMIATQMLKKVKK